MVSLSFFFLFFIGIFAVVGMMRGWAKELLVIFSVILAVFIISILEMLLPGLMNQLTPAGTEAYFWLRALILMMLVFFGYQSPNLPKLSGGGKFARDRLQDSLLGMFLGAINGFLVVGTLWYYLHVAGYPFPGVIRAPDPTDPFTGAAFRMLPWLAPIWLKGTLLYISVALAFVFILVVLI